MATARVDDGFGAPNKAPVEEGVVELLLPNRPPVAPVAGVVLEPNTLDAVFVASPPLACPNTEAELPAGVGVLLPAGAPAKDPNENLGVPAAAVEPKRPPAAGAEDVFPLDCSPDELGGPKLKAMAAAEGREYRWLGSVRFDQRARLAG